MKVYVHTKGVILAGKAWQIRRKLKEYSEHYSLLKTWIDTVHPAKKNIDSGSCSAKKDR